MKKGGAINPTLRRFLEYIPGVVAAILVAAVFDKSAETYVISGLVAVVLSALVAGYHELREIRMDVDDAVLTLVDATRQTEETFSDLSSAWGHELESLAEAFGNETHELAKMIADMRYGEDD